MTPLSKTGFTLVEMLIGIVTASIVALTAGGMLVYTYRGVLRSSAMAELERDANIAVRTLDNTIRKASSSQTVVASTNTLRVVVSGQTNTFSVVGSNLLHYAAGGPANGVELIKGRLAGFSASYSGTPSSEVFVTLKLYDSISGARMTVSNLCIRLRN